MVKKLEKVDVVTVGVGWTGGIVAAELSKAGYKVVGLERGEDRTTKDYFNLHDELKYSFRHNMMDSLSNETITHRNNRDETAEPVRNHGSGLTGTGVGGGGVHWTGQSFRYFPYDFEIRSKTIERYGKDKIPKDMPLQDWGITYDDLEPYYDKFEKIMGISGEEDPLGAERSNPYPNLPLKKTSSMKLFEKAANDLEYHPYMVPAGNASEKYENPDGQTLNACEYCAFCTNYGCEYGAKASPGVTVIPTAKATGNYEIRTNSKVKRVLHKDGKATGVLYEDTRTGDEYEQPADLVALTAFTWSNVRLLLLSEIGTPYNPKTEKGVVGKNFTEHSISADTPTMGFFEKQFNLYAGAGAGGMTFSDFNADNFDHSDKDFIHGGQIQIGQGGSAPISSNTVPEGTPSWGKEFKDKSLYYTYRSLFLLTQHAVMPSKDNYLNLDPIYTDNNGDPLLRVTFDYTSNDRGLSKFLSEKAENLMKEMGGDHVIAHSIPEHYEANFTWMHSGGGAIMGANSDTSAVNNYLQMWDMDNLFVCGAVNFPQFGTANPTLTLGALTYRATEGMIDYLESDGGQLVEDEKNKQNA